MWEVDCKESWAPKNWCFWTVVLEKALQSPLDCKEIQLVNCKRNQSSIFNGRTDAEAEAPILWPPDGKNWLIGIDSDAGKGWRWEEKGSTKDEVVGWHHRLNGHEWASSRSWWWTGKPGMLQRMGSQKVRYDWVTEQNWLSNVQVYPCSYKWESLSFCVLADKYSIIDYTTSFSIPLLMVTWVAFVFGYCK